MWKHNKVITKGLRGIYDPIGNFEIELNWLKDNQIKERIEFIEKLLNQKDRNDRMSICKEYLNRYGAEWIYKTVKYFYQANYKGTSEIKNYGIGIM